MSVIFLLEIFRQGQLNVEEEKVNKELNTRKPNLFALIFMMAITSLSVNYSLAVEEVTYTAEQVSIVSPSMSG